MGDLIEITTWPKHLGRFYKITSNALSFEIMAPGNAAIGLSRKPVLPACDYWIIIGERQRCWIKKGENGHRELAVTRGILSAEEYRRFWLTWHSGLVSLGHDGYSDPIVSCANNVQDMKYVTFAVVKLRNPVHWRFEISPIVDKVTYKGITGGKFHWVRYVQDDELPDELLIGGYEDESLYIARAHHRGSLTPGKFVPTTGTALIPWGGQAVEKQEFEVLCGLDGVWVSTIEERIPTNAYIAGYSEDGLERLYIGRALYEGHLIPGKVAPSHGVCYIPYRGREIAVNKYEILVVSNENERSANRLFIADRVYERPDMEDYDEPDSDYSNETDEENVAL